jgi:nucleolin
LIEAPKEDESAELYVGNLAWTVDEEKLKVRFSEFGTVTNVKIMYNDDGRSRGAGFVTLSSKVDAEKAVEKVNGLDWEGRALKCNISMGFPFDKAQ